jgi:hypothetical protein
MMSAKGVGRRMAGFRRVATADVPAYKTDPQMDHWAVAWTVILAAGWRADVAGFEGQQVLTRVMRLRRHPGSLTLPEQTKRPVIALVVPLDLSLTPSDHDRDHIQFGRMLPFSGVCCPISPCVAMQQARLCVVAYQRRGRARPQPL